MVVNNKRLRFVDLILTSLFFVLIVRLVYLSLLQNRDKPHSPSTHFTSENPLFRGDIYTSEKDTLAVSLPFYSIFIDPSLINMEKSPEYIRMLSALGMSSEQIQNILHSQKKFRWLSRMLPRRTFFALQKYLNLSLPGITVKQEYKRVYPHDSIASSVVGFTNIDGKGLAGIEYSMENYLKPNKFSRTQQQLLGDDVILTLNLSLQRQVEQTIQEVGKELSPESISAIIMEADTGKILSMANFPSFNLNHYNTYQNPAIFLNGNISHIDEPGSTFKPLIMAYLFDKHLITPQSRFSSRGKEKIDGFTIKEANPKPLGTLSPEEILIYSSNIGMAKASQALTKNELYDILVSLHLGQPTGIFLPGEENGIVRPPKKMTERSRLVIPIGQEIGVTPLQLVEAFSAIANEGVLVPPHIIDRLEYEGEPLIPIKAAFNHVSSGRRIYSAESANLMLQYMRQVVIRGSGRKINIPNQWIAAKTGTAQIFDNEKRVYNKLNTSMISIYYSPKTKKKYILYGVIRDPKVSPNIAWGGTLAAPMVRNFILSLIDLIESKNIE